jgi:hypothetical protein
MADRFPLIVDASASPQPIIKELPSGDVLDLTGTTIKAVSIDTTLSVTGNATIGGDLTVNGTTTTLNTATLDVEDKNITLNYGSGDTSSTADGSGITIQDAVDASNNATILWNATNDEFDFSHGITLPDSQKITFGAGSDLEIYHDGSNSFIQDAGDLTLDAGGDIILDADGGDVRIKDAGTVFGGFTNFLGSLVIRSGASDNAMIIGSSDGSVIMGGHVSLGNNNKLKFGTGNPLELYHDGSNNYIDDTGTGNLILRTNGDSVKMMSGSEDMVVATKDGSVELYHDGTKKAETTATGIDVTGTANIDNLTINGAQGNADQVLTSSGSGVSWQDAGGGGATSDADGDTQIQVEESADEDKIRFDTAGTERLIIDNNGHVLPGANNTYDLGATATRWRNIYTNDLQLSNEEGDANEVDNTKGSWTIQEGAEDLFIINRKTGKQYKFKLEEV